MISLLSFQFVWGAAAGYCQHEQGVNVSHFGHHAHKHQGKVLKAGADSSLDKKSAVADLDPDCASCHLSCVSPVLYTAVTCFTVAGEPLRAAPVSGHPSHIPYVIDRPNWTLAA